MKAALLICDHVPERFSKDHGDYFDMFKRLLPGIEFAPYYVIDGHFPDIPEHDNYLITGSKYSVYDDEIWIHDLLELIEKIRDHQKKLVGICFGHQAIAESLGGKVRRSDRGYLIGVHDFSVVQNKSWMTPLKDNLKLVMLCQDQVIKLPTGSEVLAASEECPVAMYQVGDHIMGIQGHPEFTKDYNRDVFMSRKEKMGSEKIKRAIDSFSHEIDTPLISGYILNFLKDNNP